MTRTVLVTGATGLLGRQVVHAFRSAGWNTVGTGLTRAHPPAILKVNLTDPSELSTVLQEVKPDVVIHCDSSVSSILYIHEEPGSLFTTGAANRFPDKCNENPKEAKAINVEASQQLAQAASKHNILLIYISTDYVFSGKPGEAPYEADATPNPTNVYGQLKLDGEVAILKDTEETRLGVVLRVPVLYGKVEDNKESAINVLMDALWKSQGKDAHVKMDDWAKRYPTNTEDVARVCLDIARKYLDDGNARISGPKILQFSSEDRMTKYEICQLLGEIMGLSLDGMTADKEGSNPKANVQRPYDTHLSTRALRDIGIDVRTQDFTAWWKREVKAFRK